MSEEVNQLLTILGIDDSMSKLKSKHHLNGRIFPFHTRTGERVKFNTEFNEIIGIITRGSIGKSLVLEDIRTVHLENIIKNLKISNEITNLDIQSLFSIDFSNIKNPIMFQYFPVLLETKSEQAEAKGKELLGYYIIKLLKLDENDLWKEYLTHTNITDLYEEVYIEALPKVDEMKNRNDRFHFFNQDELVHIFNKDLNQLMKNEKFFMSDISLLISYYFFYYVLEQSYNMMSPNFKKVQLWFAYDKEKVSSGRDAARKGYKIFNEASKDLLVNNDLLDYLNILSGKEKYRNYQEILADEGNKTQLMTNLMEFNYHFAEVIGEIYQANLDFNYQVKQLQGYLKISISNETSKRYRKSFDEFSGLSFIKSRGRLGYILNATQEFIIMFVGIIIGDKEKMLVNKLFQEFEYRGIFFDNQSKKEIILFFEDINILEKLSDSGDAQYVKSIL